MSVCVCVIVCRVYSTSVGVCAYVCVCVTTLTNVCYNASLLSIVTGTYLLLLLFTCKIRTIATVGFGFCFVCKVKNL